ncbi:MAG: hypothetical protein J5637_06565 [Prevotella sp.]|nr:hypothetical protein [Prevotella sp.]
MNDRTRNCPECNRPIYKYAQICPYCKSETLFASVDEDVDTLIGEDTVEQGDDDVVEMPAEDEVSQAPVSDGDDQSGDDATAQPAEEHRHAYLEHLKHDTEKVKKEFNEKIGKRYSKSTIFITTVIIILAAIVLGIYIAVQMMQKETFSINDSTDNSLREVVDSMEVELVQSSTIVAKFPDKKRHCLLYVQEGKLCVFDAVTKKDSIIDLQQLNPKAIVNYNGSGVLSAYLTPNEHYIVIVAARNAGNTEFGLYRLSADDMSLEVIDKGRVTHEKDEYVVTTDLRRATYDANGDRLTGVSGADGEPVVATPTKTDDKPKVQNEKHETPKAPEAVNTPKAEPIIPKVEIVPKANPDLNEKVDIKPVVPAGE